ncbi:MAG: valine--tRNA ligase [Ruminococcaceae bacterium]|jgi:valyl-tRNA synthetase|nr:valine--tRNA ligase [Oscillospiraceae bacterium]
MKKELPKTYSPSSFEGRIYQEWCEKGLFTPKIDKKKPHYSIVIPPPNITGQLHMGHALDNTLQDILIRYKRMKGFSTLWLPGTDHASIATEAKIVEAMRKEGLTKEDLGREKFLERAWDWREKYGGRIIEQLKKMGSSCDWTRERFTLDEGCSRAVRKVFQQLYDEGLIYRGERIINWCPHCKTSISNAEVNYEEQDGHFWHIRYPFVGGGGYLEVATTRPETMLGDTAVAVNPNDERYKHLIGQYLELPLVGRRIPVVGDEHAQLDKGTGCVKITPAHDPNDFEVGRRCRLPMEVMLTPDAKITDNYPKYAGMDRYEARRAIVKDLEAGGYLCGIEPLKHEVGTCYRCGTTIEPMVSLQWFVRMEPLAKPAIEAVRDGRIRFVPERFDKNYFHWMENTQDWCISRQLWWGHRIPAYYCDDCGKTVVSAEGCETCPDCGGHMTQDPDTLDTWFSSALWPFSTMGWPDKTEDLDYFYPTNTLVTGYDIITFWVSRMIFSALHYTDNIPFDTVLIHGLVRDAQGRKMSKSLGNGIDPLEIIDKYGADALRFALATGNSPGNDMRFSDEKIEAARNFANKLWNAARFVMMNLTIEKIETPDPAALAPEDKWILTRLEECTASVTANLDKYEIGVALSSIYDFVWDVYCDWYIELSKPSVAAGGERSAVAQNVLAYVLRDILKLLHPFMPFITEEIYQGLPGEEGNIMVKDFPEYREDFVFPAESENLGRVIDAIRAIRTRRNEMNVPPSRKAKVIVETKFPEAFRDAGIFFERLASASSLEVTEEYADSDEQAVRIVTDAATVHIPLADIIDFEAERKRLAAELENVEGEIARAEGKLSNENFVSRAPEKVVNAERDKLAKNREKRAGILAAIEKLG